MNRDEFEANWHQLKGKIRDKWSKFTNEDIAKFNGKYEQFLGALQKKYMFSKEKAEQEMRNWQKELEKRVPFNKEAPHFKHDEKHHDERHKDKKRKAG